MRFPSAVALTAVFTACVPLKDLSQAQPGPAHADSVPVGVSELFAKDAERVARAERLLEAQDVDRYEIAVSVDPRRGWMSGECTIRVRCGSGSLRLLLDENLSLSSLRDAGGANVRYERSGVAIDVDLHPAPADDTRSLKIHYEGPLPALDDSVAHREFALLGADERWYPSPPEYDAATFRIVVRYPEGYSSVCTGSLAGMAPLREPSRDPCIVGDVWTAETPIPAAVIVVGRFISSLSVSGDVFLGYHWVEGLEAAPGRVSPPERGIKELVRFLESCYGPYPYEWLNVVSAPTGVLGGRPVVSGPGLVAIDEDVWKRADGRGYSLGRLGVGLSPSWWRFWIDGGSAIAEGLAGHSAVSWYETRGDEEEALRLREQQRAEYVRALADSGGRAPLQECLGADPSSDNRICSGKGASVFGVLESVIGHEAFCAALRELTAGGGGRIDFESVVRAFEDSAERPLDWFFYEWFYRGDLPTYSLDYEVVAGGTGTVVRGIVRQDGEIYRTPIPLTIELGGWSYDEWVSIESSEQRFEFRTEMVPMEVTVDAGRLIPRIERPELARAHFQRGLEAARASDWGTAVDEFGEAASLEGDQTQYRFRYGDALVHSGRLAAGLDALESAVELAPGNPGYRLTLARLYLGALEHEKALWHFDEYVGLRADPGGRLGRARALIGLGRLDEAREAIDRVRADIRAAGAPDAAREELFLVLGVFHEAAGDSAAAVSEYEKALELNPVSDEARRRLEALGLGTP